MITLFSEFFSLEKKFFFFVVRPLPPPAPFLVVRPFLWIPEQITISLIFSAGCYCSYGVGHVRFGFQGLVVICLVISTALQTERSDFD